MKAREKEGEIVKINESDSLLVASLEKWSKFPFFHGFFASPTSTQFYVLFHRRFHDNSLPNGTCHMSNFMREMTCNRTYLIWYYRPRQMECQSLSFSTNRQQRTMAGFWLVEPKIRPWETRTWRTSGPSKSIVSWTYAGLKSKIFKMCPIFFQMPPKFPWGWAELSTLTTFARATMFTLNVTSRPIPAPWDWNGCTTWVKYMIHYFPPVIFSGIKIAGKSWR